eukprot:gene13754-biopygen5051
MNGSSARASTKLQQLLRTCGLRQRTRSAEPAKKPPTPLKNGCRRYIDVPGSPAAGPVSSTMVVSAVPPGELPCCNSCCPAAAAPQLLLLSCCSSAAAPQLLLLSCCPAAAAPQLLPRSCCCSAAAPQLLLLSCCPAAAAPQLLLLSCCSSALLLSCCPAAAAPHSCCSSAAAPQLLPCCCCPAAVALQLLPGGAAPVPGVTGHARATPAPCPRHARATQAQKKMPIARATPAPCPRHARATDPWVLGETAAGAD